ncbi:phosphopantetheine-binding protein, partial [Streptomyces sp. NPDC057889]|uniref:acyl carrier protein n=1 Tax=unclassified Streptomyces TaxID=2593676 RepID=UPI0036B8BE71
MDLTPTPRTTEADAAVDAPSPLAHGGLQLDARLRELCAQVHPEWDDASIEADTPLYFESIAAAELKALIEGEFHVSIPLPELIEEPTLEFLSDLVTDAQAAGDTTDPVLPGLVVDGEGRWEPFGLTDVQHAYWVGRSGL